MPVDLRTKDELRMYAFSRWKLRHIASNYFDIIYDDLDKNLSHSEKIEVLKQLVDWWSSPEYLAELGKDNSAHNALRISQRYAKQIQNEVVNRSNRGDRKE